MLNLKFFLKRTVQLVIVTLTQLSTIENIPLVWKDYKIISNTTLKQLLENPSMYPIGIVVEVMTIAWKFVSQYTLQIKDWNFDENREILASISFLLLFSFSISLVFQIKILKFSSYITTIVILNFCATILSNWTRIAKRTLSKHASKE